MRILLVEDDRMIGESLKHGLKSEGCAVDWVKDGDAASHTLEVEEYDLVLLDLGIPKKSGIDVLQDLRKRQNHVPVLILTARDKVADRVKGLDVGADDYLIKPFALAEVEARIRALMRRKTGRGDPMYVCGQAALNPSTKQLTYKDKTLQLSAREYGLMFALMEKPGAVISRPQLEERLYGWNEEISSNAVEVLIHQMRKKMGNDLIRNIRGIGYMVAKS